MFKLLKWLVGDLAFTLGNQDGFAETTTTTLDEAIPVIKAAALLELQEGNVVEPLITEVGFAGAGVVHETPFVTKLTSDADDSLSSQALDTGTNDEASPSQATVGVHGAYVLLKEIAELGSIDNMAAVAGKLIAQCVTVRKDLDLVTLFASLSTNQGAAATNIAPADLYDAYGSLRLYFAPLPYHLVLHPQQIWSSVGLISLFDNSADAIQTQGPGTVGEDFARYGYAGMALGFNLWSDANIALTSFSGSGAVLSKEAIKIVKKRPFRIDIQADVAEVGTKIVGTEMWGEAILRNKHGNEMQFDTV